MDILNIMEFDDYSKQPFPQMIKNNQNMQTIILYDYNKFFVVTCRFLQITDSFF